MNKSKRAFILIAFLSVCIVCLAPFLGVVKIPFSELLSFDSKYRLIFWSIRVPRVCTAFLAGAGLSLSGMAFQAMFRNPLAAPFTLGVSSGASLGAALFIRMGISLSLGVLSGITFFAFLGALAAVMLVYALSSWKGRFTPSTLLLSGVAISFFFSGTIVFIHYTSDASDSSRILHWIMGSVGDVDFKDVLQILFFVVAGYGALLFSTGKLNLFMLGDSLAISRGLDVVQARRLVFFVVSLQVGAIVAICGPIAFVGMIVPHICRFLVGWNHRYLVSAVALFGGSFLVVCDTLARTLLAPAEIPVGVITSLLGGPFFLWLVVKTNIRSSSPDEV